ncbi:FBP domain-containing protein [Actinokineospora auranticolor]|uniref:FBP domain-containing protein n=1 Tax=Actinokineospora auranticolor TaxID=155976 RepID=UPI000CECDC61|nr:FBP domain-containing protein [Actinokineospora auranticolor]
MQTLTEPEIRTSFVNCSQGEAKRLALPRGLTDLPWADLDFLGWVEAGAPDRAYLVTSHDDRLVGLSLRKPPPGPKSLTRTSICALCLTAHTASGVSLFTARKTGAAGRQGNSRGTYICADLACSLYLRGKRKTEATQAAESLTLDERILRLRINLDGFLAGVFA